jgi:hypothetical protein
MRTQINITFKTKERWLYDKLMKFSSPSIFIKDLLIQHFKGDDKNETK